jgi:hypothetical protein
MGLELLTSSDEGEPDAAALARRLSDQLRLLLVPHELRAEALAGPLSVAEPDIQKAMLAVLEDHRQSLLAAVDIVLDGDDLRYSLASRYVELKAHWIQLNVRVQYSNMVYGSADPVLIAEAGAVSFLLARIEHLVDAEYIRRINDLLLAPLDS